MSKVLILRPQPGADGTAARARELGLEPVVAPIFAIRPLDWSPPDGREFDAVMLTSANAARHCGGEAAAPLRRLPCYAVGEATATAARDQGFADVRTGPSDGAALVEKMAADGVSRALHPCGREHIAHRRESMTVRHMPIYASEPVPGLPLAAETAIADGALVLIHSLRAGAHFSSLVPGLRDRIRIAAIAPMAAEAAGPGWKEIAVAPFPRDEALLELAAKLCQTAAVKRAGL